jgi:diacylglycerol O-acyltransferase / wax synthase
MYRMSPLDASFLHVEDGASHMHIGSVAIFEGPAPAYDAFRDMVVGKLPLVPRYRQKVRIVPFNLGQAVWVDDPHFNAGYHLRHTALPPPGDSEQLRNLVGRLMSQRLDRSKPLWEMWMVEGLEGDHWALVSKVHHCLVDGVSGTDLLAVVLDAQPEPSPPVPDTWKPEPEPSDARVFAEAVSGLVVDPYAQYRAMRATMRGWRQVALTASDLLRGAASVAGVLRPTVQSTLNGPIGPHRRWAWARTSIADVKTVRKGLGGTVNDVVLAVVTRGFRDILLSRGEQVDDRAVRTLVPVSVRTESERGTYNNRVSGMIATLPVGMADPTERLASIRTQMDGLKESKQAVAGEVLTSLSGFAPPLLLALGARVVRGIPQRNVNTVTTNVPGPQFPLYAAGSPMREAFPFVPIAGHVRVGVAIFSYNGMLNYGVTGDYDTAADIDVLCRGIEEGMKELLALVSDSKRGSGGGTRDGRAPRRAPGGAASTRTPGA